MMIALLRGKLVEKRPPILIVDVMGVGYELEAPMTTFYDLPAPGADVLLHTHLVVREDAQRLYGFSLRQQRDLFRSLLRVSGVGPRVALAILSGLSIDEFIACMTDQDVDRLTRVPGIGRKTAQRLIVEMRDRLAEAGETSAASQRQAGSAPRSDPVGDAVSALIALGYKPVEASRVVRNVAAEDLTSEQIIRHALRSLSGAVS
jgi:Holliday junction DNA helicase RuvA